MSTISKLARLLAVLGLAALAAHGAFIVEPNGLATSNYSAGTPTTNSTLAGAGTLLAPGLTANAASVYGGEPYTYVYTPATDSDNITNWSSGTVLNSPQSLFSSGLLADTVEGGIYNIYHVFPQTTNASGQPTLYQILVDGGTDGVTMIINSQDQNVSSGTTGVGTGLWELLGKATVTNPSQQISVEITTTSSGFVGARTAGVLFEYAAPIPEPVTVVLLGFGLAMLGLRRRR